MLYLKNNFPLVSVFLRTYNREKILPRAIESVLEQTYENFELIIIDDCSTDCTREVIREYLERDKRVLGIFRKKNGHGSTPREEPLNDGVRDARGKYFTYIDDDDMWKPSFLEVLTLILIANPNCPLAYCDIQEHTTPEGMKEIFMRDKRKPLIISPTSFSFPHLQNFGGLIFDETLKYYPDYVGSDEIVFPRWAFEATGNYWAVQHPLKDKINQIQGPHAWYRVHNDLEFTERIVRKFPNRAIYVPILLADVIRKNSPEYYNPYFKAA